MENNYRWDIFISYSHSIKEFVKTELIDPLVETGVDVYWDGHDDFPLTGRLIHHIVHGIKSSKKTIIVLSEQYTSGNTGWCEFESAFAATDEISLNDNEKIIVLTCEQCSTPPELRTAVQQDISQGVPGSLIRRISDEVNRKAYPAFQMSTRGSVLAVGSHWDDLLIGCLGTLLKLRRYFRYEVAVLVLCNTYTTYYRAHQPELSKVASEMYRNLCRKCGFRNLNEISSIKGILDGEQLSDRSLREQSSLIKTVFKQLSSQNNRDREYNIIFSPPVDDRNDDHAVAGEVVFSNFRSPSQSVLEYSIKRYTERPFLANICVSLDEEIAKDKINIISDLCEVEKKVKNSSRLFAESVLDAFMSVNAIDFAKNPDAKYAEIFRGRVEL
jgi:LmbE family N-acetylglucosaminyl deacetylase